MRYTANALDAMKLTDMFWKRIDANIMKKNIDARMTNGELQANATVLLQKNVLAIIRMSEIMQPTVQQCVG